MRIFYVLVFILIPISGMMRDFNPEQSLPMLTISQLNLSYAQSCYLDWLHQKTAQEPRTILNQIIVANGKKVRFGMALKRSKDLLNQKDLLTILYCHHVYPDFPKDLVNEIYTHTGERKAELYKKIIFGGFYPWDAEDIKKYYFIKHSIAGNDSIIQRVMPQIDLMPFLKVLSLEDLKRPNQAIRSEVYRRYFAQKQDITQEDFPDMSDYHAKDIKCALYYAYQRVQELIGQNNKKLIGSQIPIDEQVQLGHQLYIHVRSLSLGKAEQVAFQNLEKIVGKDACAICFDSLQELYAHNNPIKLLQCCQNFICSKDLKTLISNGQRCPYCSANLTQNNV